jgi:multiple sugar transport system substrate-binding protein
MENKRKVSRRDFLKLGATGSAALALASCAPSEESAPAGEEPAVVDEAPADEPVEINFLAWGDIVDVPVWGVLGDMYTEHNPNVTVNITHVPDPGGGNFYSKFRTMVAGGEAPHVASAQGWEWQPFADDGVLAPLDDYIKLENFTTAYPDIQAIKDSTIRDGKTYLVPLQIGMMLMFYVKSHFDEAGLPYPTEDWTVDEFLDTAMKLTKQDGDSKQFGYQANNTYARDIHWIMTSGKREFDQLVDPTKAQFNQPEIAEMLQLMVGDVFNGNTKVSPTPADLEGGSNTIDTGNVSMKYEGPWFFGRLDNAELRESGKNIDFDCVMMPKGRDGSRKHRGWAEGVVVPASDNPEAGWGFAKFMGDSEGNKVYCEATGRIPNDPALIESWWLPTIKESFGVDMGDQWLKISKNLEVDVIGISRASIWNECAKPLAWDPMVAGDKTAAEVLPELDACVQGLLDELNS